MASSSADDVFDRFLDRRGHAPEESWNYDHNKKQCPECGGLHDTAATRCDVCGWQAPST